MRICMSDINRICRQDILANKALQSDGALMAQSGASASFR